MEKYPEFASHTILVDLIWEMGLRLDFGMTRGVEIKPSRKLF
jgi:hypothetical protein